MIRPRISAAVVCVACVFAFAEGDNKPSLPDGAKGFAGTLSGEVISVLDNGIGFRMRVKEVDADKESKAAKPDALKGAEVLINAQFEKGEGGWHPKGDQVAFIKALQKGQKATVNVINDEVERLHIRSIAK